MERLREGTGIHTCDRRSTKTYIKSNYPDFVADKDPFLTEEDTYWDADLRETDEALANRLRKLLDHVMATDNHERISMTAHSGAIGAILSVIGHRRFALNTGAVIPVLVQAEPIVEEADVSKRHGGKAEGGNHANDDGGNTAQTSEDRSQWQAKPDCPAGMNLKHIGQQRWNMGLKEYLAGIEDGSVKIEEVDFHKT
jgi:broad specificity phosphatase PhoE